MNKEKYLRDVKVRFLLTRRETDTLRCLLDGLKNADIAKNLAIAEQTVKDHLSKIYRKIGVKNRFELMRSLVKSSGRKAKTYMPEPLPAEREFTEASLTDELTGICNRRGLLALVEQQMKIARRQKQNVCMLHAEVERTKTATDTSGPNDSDVLLRDAANILKDTFRESDVIARVGGDEFVVIPLGASKAEADRVVARLQKNLELFNSKRNGEHALSIRYGASHHDPAVPCPADEILLRIEEERSKK